MIFPPDMPQAPLCVMSKRDKIVVWNEAGKSSLRISAKPAGVGAASQRLIWIADAHRDDGKRYVVHAEEKLTAFLELEAAISNALEQE
jgi:hypothetical protein